jgi:hypothetical protein
MFEYKKLNHNFVVGNGKLKKALGIDAMPFPLVDGMVKSIGEYAEFMKTTAL